MAWLASAILGTELLICIKYGKGMYPNPWPSHIVLIWSVALGSFAIFSLPEFLLIHYKIKYLIYYLPCFG